MVDILASVVPPTPSRPRELGSTRDLDELERRGVPRASLDRLAAAARKLRGMATTRQ